MHRVEPIPGGLSPNGSVISEAGLTGSYESPRCYCRNMQGFNSDSL
jgi:hypothetical protein